MNTLKALWANALLWLIRPALEELDRRKAEADRLFNAEHKKYWDKVNARRTEERRKEQAARLPEFASPAERRAFRAAESAVSPRAQ